MLRVLLLSCFVSAFYAAPKADHLWKSLNRNEDDQSVKFESAVELDQEWAQFKVTQEKSYSDAEEEKRKLIFAANLKEIEEHNDRYDRGLTTWKMGINQFTDLTKEEFLKKVTCIPQMNFTRLFQNITTSPKELFPENRAVPDEVDWRSLGYVTRVKNQGSCGSCWSFATVGAVESLMWQKTGEEVYLSEQHLVDCSKENSGCDGGLPHLAFDFIKQNGGIETADGYQYEAEDGRCRYDSRLKGGQIDGWVLLPEGSERLLQRAVAFAGPVAVAIDADLFQHYDSGILHSRKRPSLNHAVLLVGYKTSSPGRDYWILKNSWGTKWGMDGYALLARNAGNNCGIGGYGSYPRIL